MQIVIHPYEGIEIPGKSRILFGMTREQVRAFFDEMPEEVWASEESEMLTDMYQKSSLQFSYHVSERLKSIAIANEHEVFLETKSILHTPYAQIEAWLLSIDSKAYPEEFMGIRSPLFGIEVWAPDADEGDAEYTAESIFLVGAISGIGNEANAVAV
jgi:hypothetical protein